MYTDAQKKKHTQTYKNTKIHTCTHTNMHNLKNTNTETHAVIQTHSATQTSTGNNKNPHIQINMKNTHQPTRTGKLTETHKKIQINTL